MNKKDTGWLVPSLIVAVNALALLIRWRSLAAELPAHFDLQGHASGSMARGTLLYYPVAAAVICLVLFLLSRRTPKTSARTAWIILATGLCTIILSSTLVTLTGGTMPFFMLAEPVILVITLAVFCYFMVKARS